MKININQKSELGWGYNGNQKDTDGKLIFPEKPCFEGSIKKILNFIIRTTLHFQRIRIENYKIAWFVKVDDLWCRIVKGNPADLILYDKYKTGDTMEVEISNAAFVIQPEEKETIKP